MTSRIVESLLAAHRCTLVAFAERRLGSRAAAEDVVQQASIRALGGADRLRDAGRGRAWLFQITRRLVVDQLRERAMRTSSERQLPVSDEDAAVLGCSCVIANLQQLAAADAHILRRSTIDGVSAAALASELGVSPNAATVRLSRARASLREQLRNHCGTESLRDCIDCACNTRGCCATETGAE